MRASLIIVCGVALALTCASCTKKKQPGAGITNAPPAQAVEKRPPVMVVFRPDTEPSLSQRFAADDRMDIRLGPSRDYPEVSSAVLQRGQRIFVMDETNAWIRVRATEEPGPGLGWINKFASLPAMDVDTNLSAQEEDVALLQRVGLLLEVKPELNEALIRTNAWNNESLVVRRGVGRSLAYYCGLKKGSNTRWVQLTDSDSGQRIGRYSETSGFTDYSSLRRPPAR